MEIKEIKLYTNHIDEQAYFYQTLLGFPCKRVSKNLIYIYTHENTLVLQQSNMKVFYHFAFIIPTGSLYKAIDFLAQRNINLLPLNNKNIIEFTTGRSIYFYDNNNIVES